MAATTTGGRTRRPGSVSRFPRHKEIAEILAKHILKKLK